MKEFFKTFEALKDRNLKLIICSWHCLTRSRPHRYSNLRVGSTVIEKPLIVEKRQPFQKTDAIHLPDRLIGLVRFYKIPVETMNDMCRIVFVEQHLGASIGPLRQCRV